MSADTSTSAMIVSPFSTSNSTSRFIGSPSSASSVSHRVVMTAPFSPANDKYFVKNPDGSCNVIG